MTGITCLVVGLGAGCGTSDDDGAVVAQWGVAYATKAPVAPPIPCADAGTDWVRLSLKSRRNVGAFSFDFPCASGSGLTDEIPAGSYDVTLSLLDAKMRPVSQISGAYEISRHGRTVLDAIQFQVLAWQVNWTITRKPAGMTEQLATCADVGVKTVELITQLGSEEQERYPFDCTVGAGLTQAVRAGSYGYQVRALDAAGQPVMATAVKSQVLSDDLPPSITVPFQFQ
jgi:hypothetical protein